MLLADDLAGHFMLREIFDELIASLHARQSVVLATVVSGPQPGRQLLVWPRGETLGDLGSPRLNQRAALYAEQILSGGTSSRKTFRWEGDELDTFFEVYLPLPELVVVGAVHVAVPLIGFARALGYRTIVIDPRGQFATADRFAEADRVLNAWPEEAFAEIGLHDESYLAVLTHDLKIDIPALELGLHSSARYIGVLGSRKTHAKRIAMLRDKGFTDDDIARISSPIGLDLGGRRAEEIALSIIAEMVAVGHGRSLGGRFGD